MRYCGIMSSWLFDRVVFATDFSQNAEEASAVVPLLPRLGQVVLVHVLKPGNEERPWFAGRSLHSLEETAERALSRRAEEYQEVGVNTRYRILRAPDGEIANAVLDAVRDEEATAVVVGAQGYGLIGTLLLGSVSTKVLEEAGVHVVIARGGSGRQDPVASPILCPVAFGRPSREAVALLPGLGAREVVLLHVLASDHGAEEEEAAERELARMKAHLETCGTEVQALLRTGRPSDEIARTARDAGSDLIVIPRLGRTDYIRNISIGSTALAVAKKAPCSVLVLSRPTDLHEEVRELAPEEFELVDEIWKEYRGQTADPATDRIFGLFVEGTLATVARCRRHPDGLEVDGVFTPMEMRGRGYARRVTDALVRACGGEDLYMHSTLELVGFYMNYGFVPIPESGLPPSIRMRFSFAIGDLEGANVKPMMRPAGGGPA
ncbi:nucleotide-binding universal stress UspA family protein/predicted GNAT family acetyltransferase [Methanofollis sp. W23]|uniref:GNAT family N-acetyltransferase n=1 Tax=Methanofollis sp. W23 TaxID=2817849 RepID=UPI001AE9E390|nr:nucleotide-binding universal stress UspA family protein/predicted GNAT family acetyltransferase [Methanofollis sp. W23]